MRVWRDVDNPRRQFGLLVNRTGLSLHLGIRLYRARWRQPPRSQARVESDTTGTRFYDHAGKQVWP